MKEVSSLFVVVMGMGVTFVGLTCIIFLTMLMGRIMQSAAPAQAAPKPAVPVVPAAPAAPSDGVTDEVRTVILAALLQEVGLPLEDAAVSIRKI